MARNSRPDARSGRRRHSHHLVCGRRPRSPTWGRGWLCSSRCLKVFLLPLPLPRSRWAPAALPLRQADRPLEEGQAGVTRGHCPRVNRCPPPLWLGASLALGSPHGQPRLLLFPHFSWLGLAAWRSALVARQVRPGNKKSLNIELKSSNLELKNHIFELKIQTWS